MWVCLLWWLHYWLDWMVRGVTVIIKTDIIINISYQLLGLALEVSQHHHPLLGTNTADKHTHIHTCIHTWPALSVTHTFLADTSTFMGRLTQTADRVCGDAAPRKQLYTWFPVASFCVSALWPRAGLKIVLLPSLAVQETQRIIKWLVDFFMSPLFCLWGDFFFYPGIDTIQIFFMNRVCVFWFPLGKPWITPLVSFKTNNIISTTAPKMVEGSSHTPIVGYIIICEIKN